MLENTAWDRNSYSDLVTSRNDKCNISTYLSELLKISREKIADLVNSLLIDSQKRATAQYWTLNTYNRLRLRVLSSTVLAIAGTRRSINRSQDLSLENS